MILGHQGFLTSGDQDAKTSIRIDFLISLFHDGLSSRVIHPVLVQFCSRCRLWERAVRLFRLAGEQAGTGRDIRPVFLGGGRNIICFAPGKLCFQLREIDFVTENSLPARGWETPPKSSFFTGATVARPEIWPAKDFRDTFARKQGRSGHFWRGKVAVNRPNQTSKQPVFDRFSAVEDAKSQTNFTNLDVLLRS